MDNLEKIFAVNLKKLRKECGYTQQSLGDKVGYSEKAVSKWEGGKAIPPAVTLLNLADILQTTLDDLLGYVGEPQYFLGIDGGATKTDLALTDQDGNMVNRVVLGACNPLDIGMGEATRVLDLGIRQVCQGIPFRKIAVFAGISGGGSKENAQKIKEFLSAYGFCRADNGSDVNSIVAAGLGKDDGIAVIMGTGSSAYVQKDGVSTRLGGFGYLFDKGGNGYSIGRDVIRAALCAEDGTGVKTALHRAVLDKSGADSAIGYFPEFYRMGKRSIASYAPLAIQAAEAGDPVATRILSDNMKEIAILLNTGQKMLGDGRIDVVFTGGLTKSEKILLPMIRDHLDEPYRYSMRVYRESPVFGALILAREL